MVVWRRLFSESFKTYIFKKLNKTALLKCARKFLSDKIQNKANLKCNYNITLTNKDKIIIWLQKINNQEEF